MYLPDRLAVVLMYCIIGYMTYFIDNLKNCVDFYIRKKTKISRKNYILKTENVENTLQNSLAKRENELEDKYDLSFLRQDTNLHNYKENLYILDILDKNFSLQHSTQAKILDIGSKNWFYAKGEYTFFSKYSDNIELTGIELDAYRLSFNFYSRQEIAKFYTNKLKNTNYIADDLLNLNQKFNYIVWLFPFLHKEPHLYWGLPMKHFKPETLLKHAYDSLEDSAKMFIMNQGKEEFKEQQKMLDDIGAKYEATGEISSVFMQYKHTRYVSIVSK